MTLPPETLAAATPSPPETTPMEDNKLIERLRLEARIAEQLETRRILIEAANALEALSPSNTRSSQEVEEDGRPFGQPCHSAEPEPVPVSALAGEYQAQEVLQGRIDAAIRVIEAGYDRVTGYDQCEHGRLGIEDCIGCYDEALLAALRPDSDSDRHSESRDAEQARAEGCQSGHRPTPSTPTPQIDERAAIVAWLRSDAQKWYRAKICAGMIERGDHLEHTTALPTVPVDVEAVVAEAINRARYEHPWHPTEPRPLAEEDASSKEYSIRLAQAAIAALSRTMGGGVEGLDGADPAFVATPSSQQAVSTEGFNPGEGEG